MNFVQSILNSRTPLSFIALLFVRVVRVTFAAKPMSISVAILWFCLSSTSKFAILYIVSAESKTDFLTNLCINLLHMLCKSSARNIIISSSVWYFTRNGFKTLAMYTNTCSLAGTNTSLVAFSIVEKDALVGWLLFGSFNTGCMYFSTFGQFPKLFQPPIIFYPPGCTKFQKTVDPVTCVVISPSWFVMKQVPQCSEKPIYFPVGSLASCTESCMNNMQSTTANIP